MTVPDASRRIQDAVDEVRRVISEVVRAEQLRDQLTGLPNDTALMESLAGLFEANQAFWCAFVEIDRFKVVNDTFGYAPANDLLMKVASHLERTSDFFPHGATAFRAHGDEFFVLGQFLGITEEEIAKNLDRVRSSIEGLRIHVAGKSKHMRCTVSIGWAMNADAKGEESTPRGLRVILEHANSFAKRDGRNRVVRYDDAKRKMQVHSVRDSCPKCLSSFSVDIPLERAEKSDVLCPNCGTHIARPEPPEPPPPVIAA